MSPDRLQRILVAACVGLLGLVIATYAGFILWGALSLAL